MPALDSQPWHHGLKVFERGWLSSNNLLLLGEPGEGAVLVDASHTLHAAQTVAMMHAALAGEPLARLVNTHLHSDHCGGNAALQRAFGCPLEVPPGEFAAARGWDEPRAEPPRHRPDLRALPPDGRAGARRGLSVGGRAGRCWPRPGHDPHSVMLFDPRTVC
jgi:glyoxylase-like metal-dependent hydrolase (beta-lactamase superfamily II)